MTQQLKSGRIAKECVSCRTVKAMTEFDKNYTRRDSAGILKEHFRAACRDCRKKEKPTPIQKEYIKDPGKFWKCTNPICQTYNRKPRHNCNCCGFPQEEAHAS